MAWLFPLGVLAGVMSTITGIGGGMVATLILSAMWEPARALAVTAPAMLFGNAQRTWLFREWLPIRKAWPLAAGTVVGSVTLGMLVVHIPALLLQLLMIVAPLLAIAVDRRWIRWNPDPRSAFPVAVMAGGMNATSGGAGTLLTPLVFAYGFRENAYIATISFIALCMHTARLVGYGAGGLLSTEMLPEIVVLTGGAFVGNYLGARYRDRISQPKRTAATYGVLIGSALLGVWSAAR